MRPSDSLVPFGARLRSSLANRLPRCGRLFFALWPAARALADELRVGDSCPAPPIAGFFPEEKRGPPRFLGRPLPACRGRTPRRMRRTLTYFYCGCAAFAFGRNSTLGIRNGHKFRGRGPPAHTLAHLRIAEHVAVPVARLATGWGGFPLRRTGFAPAGRLTEFHEFIAFFAPFGPAFPGRTVPPMRTGSASRTTVASSGRQSSRGCATGSAATLGPRNASGATVASVACLPGWIRSARDGSDGSNGRAALPSAPDHAREPPNPCGRPR